MGIEISNEIGYVDSYSHYAINSSSSIFFWMCLNSFGSVWHVPLKVIIVCLSTYMCLVKCVLVFVLSVFMCWCSLPGYCCWEIIYVGICVPILCIHVACARVWDFCFLHVALWLYCFSALHFFSGTPVLFIAMKLDH